MAAYPLEFQAMEDSAIIPKIRNMTDDQLQKFAELMISKGTPSAGIRAYGISDILTKGGELEAAERAKYGIAGLEFGESKRRFGETLGAEESRFGRTLGAEESRFGRQLGLEREKFAEEKKWKEREYSLFEQQLADLKEARRKEAKNWWKKYLGTALGTGLGLVTGNWLSGAIGIGKTAMTGATGQLFGGTPEQMNIVQQYPYLFGEESYAFNK